MATSLVAAVSAAALGGCGYDPAPPGPPVGECDQALTVTGAIAESVQAYDNAALTSKGTWPAPVPNVNSNATLASNLGDETLARLAKRSVENQRLYNDALSRRSGWEVNFAMGQDSGNILRVLDYCGAAVPENEAARYRELDKSNHGIDFPQ